MKECGSKGLFYGEISNCVFDLFNKYMTIPIFHMLLGQFWKVLFFSKLLYLNQQEKEKETLDPPCSHKHADSTTWTNSFR